MADSFTIANRYIINDLKTDLIGQGGMGNVYRAVDQETGHFVAVKALKGDALGQKHDDAVQRFLREGHTLNQLKHPNIVNIIATAEEKGQHMLIMEYVDGGSLHQLQQQQHGLSTKRIIKIALELADALARAHHLGVIHRDIKPGNVLIAADGTPRLSDFGMAYITGTSGGTDTGVVVGTAAYLSPEACRGEKLTPAADVWSFGIMLYELLTGEHPFLHNSVMPTLIAIINNPIPDLGQIRPDLPTELVNLIHGMLQKDQRQRINSMRLVAARLEDILPQIQDSAPPEALSITSPSFVPDTIPVSPLEAHSVITPLHRRRELILLEKVENFWIRGVLDQSTIPPDLLILTQQRYDEAVERPWDNLTASPADKIPITQEQNLAQLFFAADRALLILGTPGAGKTVTLIQLARYLIQSARRIPSQPLPVILNLSSWAAQRQPIADWVIAELSDKYQIPPRIGRPWLAEDRLTLLLDGLNEMSSPHQAACIQALNQFRAAHGLTGLVICGRLEAYKALPIKLKLGGAVSLLPLTDQQINAYLAKAGHKLQSLRLLLEHDHKMREIARSPTMLSLMASAYTNSNIHHIDGRELLSTAQYLQRLFGTYVQQMLTKPNIGRSTPEQTVTGLKWLATQMEKHHQTVFLLENLQPSWLPGQWPWRYTVLSRLIGGLFLGLIIWLFYVLGQFNIPGYSIGLFATTADFLHLPPTGSRLLPSLFYLGILGTIIGFSDLAFFYQRHKQGDPKIINRRQGWVQLLTNGALAFVVTAVCIAFFDPLPFAIVSGLMTATGFILTYDYLNSSQTLYTDIRTVDALGFDWRRTLRSGALGIGLGLITGVIYTLVFVDPTFGIAFAISFTLVFTLLGSLRPDQLLLKQRPNEGIRLSLRNGLIAALILGTIMALFFTFWHDLRSGLLGFVLFALLAGWVYGWADVVKHILVRALLWLTGCTPLNYVDFLDYATSRALLHKGAGGYIFIHRSLQEYFAQ